MQLGEFIHFERRGRRPESHAVQAPLRQVPKATGCNEQEERGHTKKARQQEQARQRVSLRITGVPQVRAASRRGHPSTKKQFPRQSKPPAALAIPRARKRPAESEELRGAKQ